MPAQPPLIPFAPFSRGVDRRGPITLLQKGFVPLAHNVVFDHGIVKQRRGYSTRRLLDRSKSTSFPLVGPESEWDVGHGTYSVGNDVWNDGGDLKSTYRCIHVHTAAAGNEPNVGATWETEWVQEPHTILSLPNFWNKSGNTVEMIIDSKFAWVYDYSDGTLLDVFGTGTNLQCFDGETQVGHVSWTEAPDGDGLPVILFTDGEKLNDTPDHTIYSYDGVSENASLAAGRVDMLGLSQFECTKQIIWYADHLLIGDYTYGGDRYRNGVAWGDLLELQFANTWPADDGAEKLLADAQGTMQRFIRLGSHLAIYFSDSIVMCDPIPTDEIYEFDVRVRGVGLIGPNAIVDVGGIHFFIGKDNIYMYDGGLEPRPIGDRVFDLFYETAATDELDRIVGQHIPYRNTVVFYYASSSGTWAKEYIAYNYRQDVFTHGTVASQIGSLITASGSGQQSVAWRCDDDPFVDEPCNGVFSQDPCSAFSFQAGFEVPTLGTHLGELLGQSDTESTDGGAPVPASFITDAMMIGDAYGTIGVVSEITVESIGSWFKLFYTTDTDLSTASWKPLGVRGGKIKFTTERIPVHIVCQFLTLKVEFNEAGGSAEIRIIARRSAPSSVRSL